MPQLEPTFYLVQAGVLPATIAIALLVQSAVLPAV